MSDSQNAPEDAAADAPIDEAPADDASSGEEELPSTAELEEPSTEKDPDEAPISPDDTGDEPSHRAVGIGVVDPESPTP